MRRLKGSGVVNATGTRPSNEAEAMTKGLLAMCAATVALFGVAPASGQPRVGFLEVWSEPTAEIVIDGADTGLRTPQTLPLPPGHHNVTLLRREWRPSTYGFKIEPARTTRLKIHLAY